MVSILEGKELVAMKPRQDGFTLIEILIGLAVTGLAVSAIYTTYNTQQRSYAVQQDVAEMQTHLRAAMHLLTNELRMAGFDPTGTAGAGVVSAVTSPASIRFTADLNGDGEISDVEGDSEDVTYTLNTASGVQRLVRANPSNLQELAPHIDALHLTFLDGDNNVTAAAGEVRSVQITMVARTPDPEPGYPAAFSYQDLQGNAYTLSADGHRRLALSCQVQCRNLGI
jgi:type IV pilus assembly protein PilW